MSTLTLVRHGQASYMADNYDQLSPMGERQARLLAEHWLQQEMRFTQVFCGPLQRQRQTAAILCQAFQNAGLPLPEPAIQPAWAEFDAIEIMRTFLPVLAQRDEVIRRLSVEFARLKSSPEGARVLDALFQRVAHRWIEDKLEAEHIEPWPAFCERVHSAIAMVRNQAPSSSRVLVVTSAGVVSAAMKMALRLADFHTMELVWMIRNASWTEFLFSGNRFSLSAFNATPHLPDKDLLTYR